MCNITEYDRIKTVKQLDALVNDLDDLNAVLIVKDVNGFKKLLKKLTALQLNAFDNQFKAAVKKSIEYLLSVGSVAFNQSHLDVVHSIFQTALGVELPAVLEAGIFKLNSQIYKFGINEVGRSVDMKLSFDVPDGQAAAVLGNHNLFWIQNYHSEQLQAEIDKILKPYLESGKTIDEVAKELESKFAPLNKKGEDYFEGLAEHTTNRVRELGKITGYEKAGVTKYEIRAVIDDRTSEICLEMNGKVFEVASGAALRDNLLGVKSPADVKDVAPWRGVDEIKGLSVGDMPPGMEFPPYHWRCRTVTVAFFD